MKEGSAGDSAKGAISIGSSTGFLIERIHIKNGTGSGIVTAGSDNISHGYRGIIRESSIKNFKGHGIYMANISTGIDIMQCMVKNNKNIGILFGAITYPTKAYSGHDCRIVGNFILGNGSFGIFTNTLWQPVENIQQQNIGFGKVQYCRNISVVKNTVTHNAGTGIMAGGYNCIYRENKCMYNGLSIPGSAGMVVAGYGLIVTENTSSGNMSFGIDVGGSVKSNIYRNIVTHNGNNSPFSVGINIGASSECSISQNLILYNGSNRGWAAAITVNGYDGDGNRLYDNRGKNNYVSKNTIICTNKNYGIIIRDQAYGNIIEKNKISGCENYNSIVNDVDGIFPENKLIDNIINGISSKEKLPVSVSNSGILTIPDYGKNFLVSGNVPIKSIVTQSSGVFRNMSVSAIVVENSGSGYKTAPTVTISGGGGKQAAGKAYLGFGKNSDKIVGILVTNGGNGYSSNPTVEISGGEGNGANATAIVGCKNYVNRDITLYFSRNVVISPLIIKKPMIGTPHSFLKMRGISGHDTDWVKMY